MSSAINPAGRIKFTIARNWKLTLLCFFTLPVLLGLGFWQLERVEEKRLRQAELTRQQTLPPAVLTSLPIPELSDHRRVIARGEFDPEHSWLLDNRQRQGRVGYEVITPFRLLDGGTLLVNRGWVPGGDTRAHRPDPPVPEGVVSLFAELVRPTEHPLLDAASSELGWPKVILALEPEIMARQLSEPLPKPYLRLDDASPGALVTNWPDVGVSAHKHLGYAFQWFAMALGLTLWFLFACTNLWELVCRRTDK